MGPRLFLIELFTLLLYIFLNFGVRILGLVYTLKNSLTRKAQKWEVITFCVIIFSIVLNIFFVQKGQWWNTVQFLYYGVFLSTILTVQFLFSLLEENNKFLTALVILIVITTLPIDIDLLRDFTSFKSLSYVPQKELAALGFLKKQPNGTVFQPLYNPKLSESYSYPFPLFADNDSSYVAALSEKQVHLSTLGQLDLVGVDYKQRLKNLQRNDCDEMKNVKYAYIVKEYHDHYVMKCINSTNGFNKIFENDSVSIYQR